MPLEKQCTNLEISKCLKELGVKQESLFYWIFRRNQNVEAKAWFLHSEEYIKNGKVWDTKNSKSVPIEPLIEKQYSAFTVAELGEMLPKIITSKSGEDYVFGCSWMLSGNPYCFYENIYGYFNEEQKEGFATEADARGKMLIYLLENKLLSNS